MFNTARCSELALDVMFEHMNCSQWAVEGSILPNSNVTEPCCVIWGLYDGCFYTNPLPPSQHLNWLRAQDAAFFSGIGVAETWYISNSKYNTQSQKDAEALRWAVAVNIGAAIFLVYYRDEEDGFVLNQRTQSEPSAMSKKKTNKSNDNVTEAGGALDRTYLSARETSQRHTSSTSKKVVDRDDDDNDIVVSDPDDLDSEVSFDQELYDYYNEPVCLHNPALSWCMDGINKWQRSW